MRKKYRIKKSKYSMPDEYISLHDTKISAIKIVENGIKLICSDGFIVGKEEEEYRVSDGNVFFEGVGADDCRLLILRGKATQEGEVLTGIPISIQELNRYLKSNRATIEIFEEFYGYAGIWLKGDIYPYKEDLGVDWIHVVIRILENTSIVYSGFINNR